VREALRLAGTFLRIGVLNELQYRVNFAFSLVQSLIAVGTSLAVLALVFANTSSLGGWSAGELLVVMGAYVLVGGVIRTLIQPNMRQLMTSVQDGTLDFLLTKPADGQLLASVRRVELWQGVDVLVGAALVVVAAVRLPGAVSPLSALAFAVTLLLGLVAIYCFWLVLTMLSFWITYVDPIIELFDGMYQAGRWPVSVYPGWLRVGFTVVVPLAFAVTVPASALTGRLTGWLLLGSVAFTTVLAAVTRVTWHHALHRYSGASA
jgi:ABC-2 type transport system permease protein